MPDMMGSEFIQIKEALDAAWECLNLPTVQQRLDRVSWQHKVQKVEAAKELMMDLARSNSR